jgi:hypothetical protein
MTNLELIELLLVKKSRDSLLVFRKYFEPNLKINWFVKDICSNLEWFFSELIAKKSPVMLIQAPPQHGKSDAIVYAIAWFVGKHPHLKIIFSSFSERLGVRANLKLQKIFDSEKYKKIFPETKINGKNSVAVSGQTLRNREILEFVDHGGYFRNTTVEGSVTGESMDLGIVDDPIKGRKEARSLTVRNGVWDWFTDDFMTRLSEGGGLLMIMTRWHTDDPAGRLIAKGMKNIKKLEYKAIAEVDEEHRKAGEALLPEHKSIEFLEERRASMEPSSFNSLYQQTPVDLDNGESMYKFKIGHYEEVPMTLYRHVLRIDTAQKGGGLNDHHAYCLTGYTYDDEIAYVLDAGRWSCGFVDLGDNVVELIKHIGLNMLPRETFDGVVIEDANVGNALAETLREHKKLNDWGAVNIGLTPKYGNKFDRADEAAIHLRLEKALLPSRPNRYTNKYSAVNQLEKEFEEFTESDVHASDDILDCFIWEVVTKYGAAPNTKWK